MSNALLNQQLRIHFHLLLCHLCKNQIKVCFSIFNLGGQYIIVSLCGTIAMSVFRICAVEGALALADRLIPEVLIKDHVWSFYKLGK